MDHIFTIYTGLKLNVQLTGELNTNSLICSHIAHNIIETYTKNMYCGKVIQGDIKITLFTKH